MHHRHLIYRLIHDLRRLGGSIIAWTLLLFIFAIFVFWPVDALLGHGAASSAVTVAIGVLIVGRYKRRHGELPAFLRAPSGQRLAWCYAALAVAIIMAAILNPNG